MNIFYLDKCPRTAAMLHCDTHTVKMILEYAQMLSTAHRLIDGRQAVAMSSSGRRRIVHVVSNPEKDALLYAATHINHPSSVWVRQSASHYKWLYECMLACNDEFMSRYGHSKPHMTIEKLASILACPPAGMRDRGFVEPPQCVTDECKRKSAVEAYRAYYRRDKADIAVWRNGNVPEWMLCEENA